MHILSSRVDLSSTMSLFQMMGHLFAVKEKQTSTDNMFEPLHATIELLKTYGQELPDEVHQQLQVCTRTILCSVGAGKQK